MHLETDVLVVGAGSTGTGVVRDLALRGLQVVLAERDDIASGTSGRNHGLLHSGGRYAVKDAEAAAECIAENRVLRQIASHTIWDSGGLFVALEGDDPTYADQLVASCERLGIEADEIEPAEARHLEPNLPPNVTRTIQLPDAMIDPFALCTANAVDAAEHGAAILTHHQLVALEQKGGTITEARLRSRRGGDEVVVRPRLVVNAAGCWAGQVAALADVELALFLSKGSLLVASNRVVRRVINRCRPPGSGDILVPGGPVTLLGTTSVTVDDPSDISATPDEVELLRVEGAKMAPALDESRILRAFAGVRPLYQETKGGGDGRAVSRGHAVIDHRQRDGLNGLLSIVGGKLTTYRKMAEDVADLACEHLTLSAPCTTQERPLPGSEAPDDDERETPELGLSPRTLRMARVRHGRRAEQVLAAGAAGNTSRLGHVCLCESVTEAEVRHAVANQWAKTVDDMRRRVRVGCGPCQGTYCGPRVASVMAEELGLSYDGEAELADEFDRERRRGVNPSVTGAQAVQDAINNALRRVSGPAAKAR